MNACMQRGSGLLFEMVFVIAGFILGLVLLVYSSNKAIEHMIQIALEWGINPFVSGRSDNSVALWISFRLN